MSSGCSARALDRDGHTDLVFGPCLRALSPGYFPFVMATSVISTGTFLLGPSWLSRALLVIAGAGLVVLSVALVIQLVLFRPSVAAGHPARCLSRRSTPRPNSARCALAGRSREKVSWW